MTTSFLREFCRLGVEFRVKNWKCSRATSSPVFEMVGDGYFICCVGNLLSAVDLQKW